MHRGAPLQADGERITMVNGYVATNTTVDDQSRCRDLIKVDPPGVLFPEWARYAAWRSASKLHHLVDTIEFGTAAGDVALLLEDAISDARQAVDEMRAPSPDSEHFEQPAASSVS